MNQIYNGKHWTVAGVRSAIAAYEERASLLEKSSDPRDLETARINRREAEWCRRFLESRPNAT